MVSRQHLGLVVWRDGWPEGADFGLCSLANTAAMSANDPGPNRSPVVRSWKAYGRAFTMAVSRPPAG